MAFKAGTDFTGRLHSVFPSAHSANPRADGNASALTARYIAPTPRQG